jgi:hypothetical protein
MRKTLPEKLEAGRMRRGPQASKPEWGAYGAFVVMGPTGRELHIIASGGDDDDEDAQGWEHVSVSLEGRPPNWTEMCFVKNLFWEDEETVLQFHPPKSSYVNYHPHCLHLWRHKTREFPLPPSIFVGPR